MTSPAAVATALADAHRRGWALALAATARVSRDLEVAEECVQEAYAAALASWARDGIPRNPEAWLTVAAKRRAMDAVRRERAFRSKLPLLVEPEESEHAPAVEEAPAVRSEDVVPDERLRLVFLCCHPALAPEARLALTLRLVCGLPTADIARALLVSEATTAARITRAKKKIAAARIPFRLPSAAELPDRLRAVLGVIHLLFTAGHTAPSGASLVRQDLVDQSLRLARILRELMPDEREVRGLLALLLVTDARRATRVDADGRLLRLEDQDRSLWDRPAMAEAHDLIVAGLRAGPPGRYLLQAAIASLYAEAPSYDRTDWPQIVTLYDELLTVWPSPVVALNRTVALSMDRGPAQALAAVEELESDGRFASYPYLPAIKADLLGRLDRPGEAAIAYGRALELTENTAEREFLTRRLADSRRMRGPLNGATPEHGSAHVHSSARAHGSAPVHSSARAHGSAPVHGPVADATTAAEPPAE
ncbi:RNA polymerase sigma factor [Streptomyces mangrovisoli]|uniref:RNA polymerase sigma factor n=1 Tax=Streptomyces mangrovisoli TaxID=1428628 RepID=UPI0009A12C7A|nr:sigma-70 family RNA polymerase sigma factor [Streptomyces mangrovisoli]